jgi:hypothetical protein
MKYASKKDLIDQIESEHAALLAIVESIPRSRYAEAGVWGEGWTIKDLLAHLTEWEQMFLCWYRDGLADRQPAMPAEGYKWSELPRLNREIWRKHRRTSWKRVREAFDRSYEEILSLGKSLSQRQLLTPGVFPWTKKHPLTTYLGANTCSHYRAAIRILKRWSRRHSEKR